MTCLDEFWSSYFIRYRISGVKLKAMFVVLIVILWTSDELNGMNYNLQVDCRKYDNYRRGRGVGGMRSLEIL